MSTAPLLPVDCWSVIAKKTTLIEAAQLTSTNRELRVIGDLCAREFFMEMDRHMSSCHGDNWLTRFGIPKNTASLFEQIAQVAKIVFGERKYLETPLDGSLIEKPLALLEKHIKKFKDRIGDLIPAIYRESWSHDVPFIRQLLLNLTAEEKSDLFQAAVDSNYWEFIALFKEAGGDVANMRLSRSNFVWDFEDYAHRSELQVEAPRDRAARMVVELSKAGLNFSLCDFYNNFRNSPSLLHAAVEYGRCSTVRALLATGMHPDITSDSGTPLHAAVQRSNSKEKESLIRILLEAGANPNIKRVNGETPMTLAICNQNIPEIRMLASFGADLHQRAYAEGSLLHTAIWGESYPSVETALASIPEKQLLVIKTLLDLGVDPAMRDNEGRTFVGSVLDGNNDQEEATAKFLLGLRARLSDPADLKI